MIYCDQCGAANDIRERNCHRCGTPLPTEAELQHVLASRSGIGAQPPADWHKPDMTSDGLSAELELPEWLRAAAAETPHDPTQATNADADTPPAGFVVEPPSRPTPAWMTAAAAAPPSDDAIEALTQAPAPPPRPVAPAPDVADTSSFITENDLPDWIRQIAAADETKRAEERRRVADAERAAATAEQANRPALPGDTVSAPAATNPWLGRRETVPASRAWDGATQPAAPAEPATSLEAAPVADQPPSDASQLAAAVVEANESAAAATKGRFGLPKRSTSRSGESAPAAPTELPAISEAKRSLPSGAPAGRSPLRLVLLGAVALLLVVLVLGLVL